MDMEILLGFWWIVPLLLAIIFFKTTLRVFFGVIIVPEDKIGIVTKQWAILGKTTLPDGKLIAMNGEAGYQADTLAPGLHMLLWPWQYDIMIEKFKTIREIVI